MRLSGIPPQTPFLSALLSLLALASCSGDSSLAPVLPPDRASLDPEVLALVDEHVPTIQLDPRAAEPHATLGMIYEANELWDLAERSYARASRLDPSRALWRLHRAICLGQLGQPKEARDLLEKLAKEFPEEAAVLQRLGDAQLAAGDASAAVVSFQSAIEKANDRAEPRAALGAALLELDRAEEAIAVLESAVRLDPVYRSGRYLLGLAYRGVGRTEDAQRELALGIEGRSRFLADPLSSEVRRFVRAKSLRTHMAHQWLEAGRPDRALRIFDRLRESSPRDVSLLNNIAATLLSMGESVRAHEVLQEALELDVENVTTHVNLAHALTARRTLSRALAHAERAVELAPRSATPHLAQGRVLAQLKRTGAALDALGKAIELDPLEPESRMLMADLLTQSARWNEAREQFANAARLRPDRVDAMLGWARAALEAGVREEADHALEAARALDPEHPDLGPLTERLAAS